MHYRSWSFVRVLIRPRFPDSELYEKSLTKHRHTARKRRKGSNAAIAIEPRVPE